MKNHIKRPSRGQADTIRDAMVALESAEYLAMFCCDDTGASDKGRDLGFMTAEITGDVETCGCAYAEAFWRCRDARIRLARDVLGNKRVYRYWVHAFGIESLEMPPIRSGRRLIEVSEECTTSA